MSPPPTSSIEPTAPPDTDSSGGDLVWSGGSGERRRSRRRPLPGVLVQLTPIDGHRASWAGHSVDINGDGLGLALPPELEVGRSVWLSFELEGTVFEDLPAVVKRQHPIFGVGAVEFGEWPTDARLSLLSFLLDA